MDNVTILHNIDFGSGFGARLKNGSGLRAQGSVAEGWGLWVPALNPEPRAQSRLQLNPEPRTQNPEPRRCLLVLCAALSICCLLPASSANAEELRDPFTFAPRSSEIATSKSITLVGVLWDTTHPLAMVGEAMVGIGDTIAGWKVADITQDGVTLQRAEQRLFLKPGDPIPP